MSKRAARGRKAQARRLAKLEANRPTWCPDRWWKAVARWFGVVLLSVMAAGAAGAQTAVLHTYPALGREEEDEFTFYVEFVIPGGGAWCPCTYTNDHDLEVRLGPTSPTGWSELPTENIGEVYSAGGTFLEGIERTWDYGAVGEFTQFQVRFGRSGDYVTGEWVDIPSLESEDPWDDLVFVLDEPGLFWNCNTGNFVLEYHLEGLPECFPAECGIPTVFGYIERASNPSSYQYSNEDMIPDPFVASGVWDLPDTGAGGSYHLVVGFEHPAGHDEVIYDNSITVECDQPCDFVSQSGTEVSAGRYCLPLGASEIVTSWHGLVHGAEGHFEIEVKGPAGYFDFYTLDYATEEPSGTHSFDISEEVEGTYRFELRLGSGSTERDPCTALSGHGITFQVHHGTGDFGECDDGEDPPDDETDGSDYSETPWDQAEIAQLLEDTGDTAAAALNAAENTADIAENTHGLRSDVTGVKDAVEGLGDTMESVGEGIEDALGELDVSLDDSGIRSDLQGIRSDLNQNTQGAAGEGTFVDGEATEDALEAKLKPTALGFTEGGVAAPWEIVFPLPGGSSYTLSLQLDPRGWDTGNAVLAAADVGRGVIRSLLVVMLGLGLISSIWRTLRQY